MSERARLVVAALLLAAPACSPPGAPLPYVTGDSALHALNATGAGKIDHVVFIVQENRSFDNLFAGYPGADTVAGGKDSNGKTIGLVPVSLARKYLLDHSAQAMFADCNGTGTLPGTQCRMNGFDKESYFPVKHLKYPMYVYVPHAESKPYFAMAHQWVLADRMFQSQLDESFTAHQYVIAAQAASSADLPNLNWGCGGGNADYVYTMTVQRKPYGRKEVPCLDRKSVV